MLRYQRRRAIRMTSGASGKCRCHGDPINSKQQGNAYEKVVNTCAGDIITVQRSDVAGLTFPASGAQKHRAKSVLEQEGPLAAN